MRQQSPEKRQNQAARAQIVVAGDVALDCLMHETRTPSGPEISMHDVPAGAYLLARELELALAGDADIVSYRDERLRPGDSHEVRRSIGRVASCLPQSPSRQASIRITHRDGHSRRTSPASALALPADPSKAAMVALYDAAGEFRRSPDAWPAALTANESEPLVIVRSARPFAASTLIDYLRSSHAARTVLVVDADDLRADGALISRRLSWERSARDLVWQMRFNPELSRLADSAHVIVRFGLEGAVHYAAGWDKPVARLFYHPFLAEGDIMENSAGEMPGADCAFFAALAARLHRDGTSGLDEGVRDGLRSARRFFEAGFSAADDSLQHPGAEVFAPAAGVDDRFPDAAIPFSTATDSADPDFWCLLRELDGRGIEPLAHQILLGDEREALRDVPVGQFGALRTVDREEIESYRSIQGLIGQYLDRRETKRPLCLAVFGPPGSGKSFGVEQVAKSISSGGARVEKLQFNMAQFQSTTSLGDALHSVRDEVVKGGVPLVFFDEFDSAFEGQLGWLRYFLAPMQDGAFLDDSGMHPVGKAIFVFAGGLSATFAEFSRQALAVAESPEAREELRRFRDAKGPDFVSRLRGFVNVKGLNPDPARPEDRAYLIRRAMIARSLLERSCPALRSAVNPGTLNLSESVARALVGVPAYRHGVRSMEAVIDMSRLEGRTIFDPAALPAFEQLDQHVDADAFHSLVARGVLFNASREAIAEAIHENYLRDRGSATSDSPAGHPWAELPEDFRQSNRAQASDLMRKLERVDCGFRPAGKNGPSSFDFSEKEVEVLAELEHQRWKKEKEAAGYSWGAIRDDSRRTHPDLVPWSSLTEETRAHNRETAAAIPSVLARARFEVYRL